MVSMAIEWHNAKCRLTTGIMAGRIKDATFEIFTLNNGFGANISYRGDEYAILHSAKTVEEAKNFCEFTARGYDLEKS